jgi:hypothetical protein
VLEYVHVDGPKNGEYADGYLRQMYGNLERGVKWLKFLLILGLCVLMIAVNVGCECFPPLYIAQQPSDTACVVGLDNQNNHKNGRSKHLEIAAQYTHLFLQTTLTSRYHPI